MLVSKLVLLLKRYWILCCILLFGFLLGIFQLDKIPGEMWGDATYHYYLVQQVQESHNFISYRYGGDGPIYTYLATFIAALFGLSFYSLKLTSVFISLFFIWSLYFLSFELFKSKTIAAMSSFLAAVSFWSLTFARQPHARILVPLFITLTLLLALKKKPLLSGIFLGLGMYTQASIWALPFVFLKRFKIFLLGLIISIPLVISFFKGSVGFFTDKSYFGEKLGVSTHLDALETLKILFSNLKANILSYTVNGDLTFRVNVPGSPHLDFISGILFCFGLVLIVYKIIKEKQYQLLQFFLLPFIIIQIPSLLDIHNPLSQPNIGRMIGVIPFVFMAIAYGMDILLKKIFSYTFRETSTRTLAISLSILYLLVLISISNLHKYFIVYPNYLPNQNTPFAEIIASHIDALPTETEVIIFGQKWSEWEQPEYTAIADSLKTSTHIAYFSQDHSLSEICEALLLVKHKKIFIVADPQKTELAEDIASCGLKPHVSYEENKQFTIAQYISLN